MKKLLLFTFISCATFSKPTQSHHLPGIKKIAKKMEKFDAAVIIAVFDYKADRLTLDEMTSRIEEIAQERMDYLADEFEGRVYRGEDN